MNNKSRYKYRFKDRLTKIKKTYGVSSDEYYTLFQKQEGKCPICKNEFSEEKRAIHVDHCHNTGEVRGLLCNSCNNGIGKFADNIVLLEKAAIYLNKYK